MTAAKPAGRGASRSKASLVHVDDVMQATRFVIERAAPSKEGPEDFIRDLEAGPSRL